MEYRPVPGTQGFELNALNTAYLGNAGTQSDYNHEPVGYQRFTDGPSITKIQPNRRCRFPRYNSALVQFILIVLLGSSSYALYRYCLYRSAAFRSSGSQTAFATALATTAFFGGPLINRFGVKTALFFGFSGYPVFMSAVLCFNYTANIGFAIFAHSLLGCCNGIYWCVIGQITMSYPTETFRGRYVSVMLLASLLGELAAWVAYYKDVSTYQDSGNTVPIIFLVLTAAIAGCTWFLVNPKDVVRSDGSRVDVTKRPTFTSALKQLQDTFVRDTFIFCLFPLFFASNWLTIDELIIINNSVSFLTVNTLNITVQIVGGIIFGCALDFARLRRPTRATIAWITLFVSTSALWGGTYAYQHIYNQSERSSESESSARPTVLYAFHGLLSAAWQICIYWLIGSITIDAGKLAIFAGFLQGLSVAGSNTVWGLYNSQTSSDMTFYTTAWFLLAVSLVVAAPVFLWMVTDPVADGPQIAAKDDSSLVTNDHSKFGKSNPDIVLRPMTPLSRV